MRCFYFISWLLFCVQGLFAQSEQLAQNYLDKGEYEKAVKTYQSLVAENPANSTFFYGLITSHQQLEDFQIVENLLLEKLEQSAQNPTYLIELGYNYQLQKNEAQAQVYYSQALDALQEKPNYAYSIARSFEKYSLLDLAAQTYELGMQLKPGQNYYIPLARIYGEQGELEKMFQAYLDLIDTDPQKNYNIIREFDRFIQEDSNYPANEILRKILIVRLQKNPALVYNEILGWLYVQQKEFKKAFIQEKAIYRRNNQDLQRIMQLTVITKNEGDLETAKEIVDFIIKEAKSENLVMQARQLLLDMKIQTASRSDYPKIKKEFLETFQQFGWGIETMGLQIDYANFIAFKTMEIDEALKLLEELADNNLSNFQQAALKMVQADILVLDQKFNRALILYSQIQNLVKNDEIAQTARYKVAKTSYYKGDFAWAKTQLDVLKASATQLIANDAMELSLLIQENSLEDSLQTALKLYARADLLAFQNNNLKAIEVLDQILVQHKGEKIEDEALFKQALLYEAEEDWNSAESNYLKILELFKEGILADNATWQLAELYHNKMDLPMKARDFYEQIIFNYPDSIYFVDARKNFRRLRGDIIE